MAFGGQALIEGVMIRSRTHIAMCVRKPDNEILSHVEPTHSIMTKHRLLRVPILRGIVALFETFYLGVKGINFSANVVLDEEAKFTYKEFAIVIALTSLVASFFIVAPFLLTTLLNLNGLFFNIGEALVRLTLFVLYLVLIAQWHEFKRILQYHGAEHKTINAFEMGAPLNISTVKTFSRFHPRCGTSFIFIVLIVSIVLFSLLPNLVFVARLAYRVLLIPVIGAISYELLKLSDRYQTSRIMRILTMPGLVFQRLTTREPTEDMLAVAIKAVTDLTMRQKPRSG